MSARLDTTCHHMYEDAAGVHYLFRNLVANLSGLSQAGHSYFRIHPKGNGIVVRRPGGLAPVTFVSEYLGELHTPARWFEIQVTRPCVAAADACLMFQLHCVGSSVCAFQSLFNHLTFNPHGT